MKVLIRATIVLIIVFCVYNVWVLIGVPKRTNIIFNTTISEDANISFGSDIGKGNILGIQPYLTALNYANIPTFKESIRAYLVEAKKNNLINAKTVVVLPEHIGSFLLAYEEKESVYQKLTLEEAMKAIITANLFKFGVTYFSAPTGIEKATYAVLALKADQTAKIYWEVFSELAKEFNVTIAAGSIVLPNATRTETGIINIKNGTLFNTAAIFNPDGKITIELDKVLFPVEYLSGGFMKSFGASVRVFSISEAKSGWSNYTPNSALADSTIRNGMAIGLAGKIWDKKQDGRLLLIQNGISTILPASTKGRLINCWIN